MKVLSTLFFIQLCLVMLMQTTNSNASDQPITEQQVTLESDSAVLRLSSYLENLDSYVANFQQQVVGSNRKLMDTSSGQFFMKRPDRFRWEIFSPYEQIIIADGQTLWSVDIDLEQVTISDIDSSMANTPILLLSRKNNRLAQQFDVELMDSDEDLDSDSLELPMERFVLTPKDQSSNFENIQLGFRGEILYLFKLYDSLGQVTIITMSNVRRNPMLSQKPFTYLLPEEHKDFDIIDSRAADSRAADSRAPLTKASEDG